MELALIVTFIVVCAVIVMVAKRPTKSKLSAGRPAPDLRSLKHREQAESIRMMSNAPHRPSNRQSLGRQSRRDNTDDALSAAIFVDSMTRSEPTRTETSFPSSTGSYSYSGDSGSSSSDSSSGGDD
ncbi:hypothetical protein VPHD527_0127 [Vibrio phage D527]